MTATVTRLSDRRRRNHPGMSTHKDVPESWRKPLTDWTLHLSSSAFSATTIQTRTDHLRRIARAHSELTPWDLTYDDLAAWAGVQTWRRETRRSVYASLRGFWRWAVRTGRCDSSPAEQLPTVAPEPPLPRPTPEHVYRTALLVADARCKLILRLAGEAGLRRAEIAQVHASDLIEDLTGWSLMVHGKGGRDRLVPLTSALALMVRTRARGGWCFPGDCDGHLSPRYVGVLASRLLPNGWTLHTLRHRFASVAFQAERDLLSVQQLLGHTSVATTQRYVQVPDDALRAAIAHAV